MDFLNKHRIIKHFITVFFPICIVSGIFVLISSIPAVRVSAGSFAAETAFYIPENQKKQTSFFHSFLLENCFFGQSSEALENTELDDKTTKEQILILSHTQNPSKTNSEISPALPEAPISEFVPEITTSDNLMPILECDLSASSVLSLNNTTKKRPDTKKLLNSHYDFEYTGSDEPLVLIIHTHATESYSRENSVYYDPNALTHTTNTELNMISVGKVMAEALNDNGINALHCTLMHDKDSYSNAYPLAAETIKTYLSQYPSIKYIFDIHRDAIMYDSGAKARPVCTVKDESAAQIMLLAGTDAGGANFPHWEKNLTLALKLADKMNSEYPSIMRSTALRGASYNEQYTDGSLLVEIGTDGNTLSQAKLSAKLLGEALANLIKGN